MAKERQNESCLVDDEDRIFEWSRHAALNENGDDVDELGDVAPINPVTPTRRPLMPGSYAEISPRNTSFSGGSIFDTPPTPVEGRIEDVFGDDVPEKEYSDGTPYGRGEYKDSATPQLDISIDHGDSGSHASYHPPSEATADLEREIEESSAEVTIPHLDRDKQDPYGSPLARSASMPTYHARGKLLLAHGVVARAKEPCVFCIADRTPRKSWGLTHRDRLL